MTSIVISSGHGLKIRGARGNPVPPQLDEVDQARRVVPAVVAALRSMGHTVTEFHDDVSTTQSANLNWIVNHHNGAGPHDLDVSVHFNAYNGTANGCEVLYVTQQALAADISAAIAGAGGFTNRGAKYRSDLKFLNATNAPAVLLETCFCDNTNDSNKYNASFDAICNAIAGALVGEEPPDYTPPPGGGTTPPDNPYDVPLSQRPTISRGDHGQHVTDLQRMLPHFTGTVDGDFGPITEEAVLNYQRSRGLDVDGIVGPQTWGALYAHQPPLPPPAPPPGALSVKDQKAIMKIANDSWIASYDWRDRGQAPTGYTQGMALAFAQTYLKLKSGHPAAQDMARARRDSDKDALNVYRSQFDNLGMSNETAGPDTLRHLYALMLGHGMRESSGRHCEGRDQSASNVQSDTAEAGLFQTSYNAHSASDPEFDNLMTEYQDPANESTCYLTAFEEDVSCSSSDWENYGSGTGAEFQALCKECPAFAVETCALTLRNLCNHYGPIIREETELKSQSDEMFRAVQSYVDTIATDPPAAVTDTLAGKPLRYLIGLDESDPQPSAIVEIGYDATRPVGEVAAKYVNLRDEKDSGNYAPYLPPDDIESEYGEPAPDPDGPGFWTNLEQQLTRAANEGFRYVELDNLDTYDVTTAIKCFDAVVQHGLKVFVKNPIIVDGTEVQLLEHPAACLVIVEEDCGGPAAMHNLRYRAGKPTMPVRFVAYESGKSWADGCAATIKMSGYTDMGVTWSPHGEYDTSEDILVPSVG
jgi:peptidoglycan hydrolase-like protein with peptidoglycan-binding domain